MTFAIDTGGSVAVSWRDLSEFILRCVPLGLQLLPDAAETAVSGEAKWPKIEKWWEHKPSGKLT